MLMSIDWRRVQDVELCFLQLPCGYELVNLFPPGPVTKVDVTNLWISIIFDGIEHASGDQPEEHHYR
jgi:hypothetical protein